jgi:hypothetical protein
MYKYKIKNHDKTVAVGFGVFSGFVTMSLSSLVIGGLFGASSTVGVPLVLAVSLIVGVLVYNKC